MASRNKPSLYRDPDGGVTSGKAAATQILVVEDKTTQRTMLVEYLSRQDFQATGLSDGAALRRALQRDEPELVLLDLGLPGEDGRSLARWMRETHPKVAVIMVTATGRPRPSTEPSTCGSPACVRSPPAQEN